MDKKASVRRGKPKAIVSSASAGGLGVSFENRVQAVRLLGMCLGTPSPGVPEGWTIVELRFQARVHGTHTDDLVCTVESASGARRKVLLQMKAGMTARLSDPSFEDAVGGAWLDYQQTGEFVKNEDSIVIVHDASGKHLMSGAAAVANTAHSSLNVRDWLQKIESVGASSVLKRNSLMALRSVVALRAGRMVDDVELLSFLQHVSFLAHDLEEDGTPEHIQWVNQVGASLQAVGFHADPHLVWSKLVTSCMGLNAVSAGVNIATVASVVGEDLAQAFRAYRQMKPASPGAGWRPGRRKLRVSSNEIRAGPPSPAGIEVSEDVGTAHEAMPVARKSSTNSLVSRQLDDIKARIKEGRYQDAAAALAGIGGNLALFDEHQSARWYLMRGACKWHLGQDDEAASDFLRAAELCDDDDRISAGRVRGLLLRKDFVEAASAGRLALERFPLSLPVWLMAKNAEVLTGVTMTEEDVPTDHRDEADAIQLVAWTLHRKGDVTGAARLMRKASALSTSSFVTRECALRYSLESVGANALHLAFHMLMPEEHAALASVVEAFEPRFTRLWTRQSPATLRSTVVHLGYAYIFLGRSESALNVLREARLRDIDDPDFIRLEMEALRALGQLDKAMSRGHRVVGSMPADALVTYAQICATAGETGSLERALEAASHLKEDREQVTSLIQSLRWEALRACGRMDEVLRELDALDLAASTSVPMLVQATQVLSSAGQAPRAARCLDRAARLLRPDSSASEYCLVAMSLLQANRYDEAAVLYEGILPEGVHSELHNDLLYCHVRTGDFRRAKQLLASFPADWMRNEDARQIAMELAQEAGDWDLLSRLSLSQLDEVPHKASSWACRLMAAGRVSRAALLGTLPTVPADVQGSIRELTQIAACEMENGFETQGLNRLYRMRRLNLDDVDIAAAHLSAHWMVQRPLPHHEEALQRVGPGTCFTAEDADGHLFSRAIDPAECTDLPEAEPYCAASAAAVRPFLGAALGSEVHAPGLSGVPTLYRLVSIGSTYRHLLDSSMRLLKQSLAKSALLTVVHPSEDETGQLDFAGVRAQAARRSQVGRQVMNAYRAAPLTVGAVCRLFGQSVVRVLRGWPKKEAKLQVGRSPAAARAAAAELLARPLAPYVVDAATLVELGLVGCLHLLSRLNKPYCSTKTCEIIREELEEAKRSRTPGRALEPEAQRAIAEPDEQDLVARIDLLQALLEAIDSLCEVRPSYGPEDRRKVPRQWCVLISVEEAATLTLALELDATLLCLDARLRMLATVLGLNAMPLQAFLSTQLVARHLSRRDYSVACLRMFLAGRTFISLDANDLMVAVYQGKGWINAVLSAFVEHIADEEVEFESALDVVLGFLVGLARAVQCQFGFVVEITSVLVEGLARHRQRPPDLPDHVKHRLRNSPGLRMRSMKALNFLSAAIDGACQRARRGRAELQIKGTVLKCSSPPWLLNGLTLRDAEEILQATVLGESPSPEALSRPTIASGVERVP